jgi:hypothetical protein
LPQEAEIVRTLPAVGAQRDFAQYDRAHPGLFLGPKFLTARAVLAVGELDLPVLTAAVEHMVAAHEALRVGFALDQPEPPHIGQIVPDRVSVNLEVADWTDRATAEGLEQLAQEALRHFFRTVAFPVTEPPLFGVRVYRLGPGVAAVCLGFHHMVMDGEGAEVVMRHLFLAYDAVASGRTPDEPTGVSWSTYCQDRYAKSIDPAAVEQARDFWKAFFVGGVETGYPAPPIQRPELAGVAGIAHHRLTPGLSAAVEEAARGAGTLLGAYSGTVFGRFLAKQVGRDEVTFFCTQTARVPPRLRDLPGLMLLLFAIRVSRTDPLRDVARRVQEHILGANRSVAMSGAFLRELSRPSAADLERFATREVAVAFQLIPNRPVPAEAGGLSLRPVSRHGEDEGSSPCSWLEFHLRPGDDAHLLCRYDAGRFEAEQVELMLDALAAELAASVATA